jgi:hypothetical protein
MRHIPMIFLIFAVSTSYDVVAAAKSNKTKTIAELTVSAYIHCRPAWAKPISEYRARRYQ